MNKANKILRSLKIVKGVLGLELSLKSVPSQMEHTYYTLSSKGSGITKKMEK